MWDRSFPRAAGCFGWCNLTLRCCHGGLAAAERSLRSRCSAQQRSPHSWRVILGSVVLPGMGAVPRGLGAHGPQAMAGMLSEGLGCHLSHHGCAAHLHKSHLNSAGQYRPALLPKGRAFSLGKIFFSELKTSGNPCKYRRNLTVVPTGCLGALPGAKASSWWWDTP